MAPVVAGALIAGGASVVGGIFNWLSGKSQANAQKAYQNLVAQLHNQWLDTRDAQVKGILDELVARGQDIYGPQKMSQTGTSSTSGTSVTDEEETPTLTAEYQPLAGLQRSLVERRLTSPTGLPAGYEQTGVEAINAGFRGADVARQNLARSRGLSEDVLKIGDPNERARAAATASFRANLPLQARELQTQDINLAEAILQKGIGRKRKGKTTSRSTTDQASTSIGPPDYSSIANLLLTPGPRAATM